jgi:hypothetical protein
MLKALENQLDEDSVKYTAITLANLSSHRNFLKGKKDEENSMVKSVLTLLKNATLQKVNLIQAACITLCNFSANAQLQKHFVSEPEISILKEVLTSPSDRARENEVNRILLKTVSNLAKNPLVQPKLFNAGFFDILAGMLKLHEL